MESPPLKILVVDDSALYRQSIRNALRSIEDAQWCGNAKDGLHALERIEELDPDLMTLDVQMPDMDGIELLREIKRRRLRVKAIMVSGFTAEGAEVTTEALMEGAFDFILKPSANDSLGNRQRLQTELQEKIAAFRQSSGGRKSTRRKTQLEEPTTDSVPTAKNACRAIVIGTSTGGPAALKTVLAKLPEQMPVPVLVVQHMPATYTATLAARLDSISPLSVVEASDAMEAVPGRIIIAAGGKQMRLADHNGGLVVNVIDAPAENGVRPSVDFLLRSVTEVLAGDALAVILTGMGRDGLEGCRMLKQAGGYVFAQSQCDSVVYGMPKAVTDDGLADRTLPLGKVAPAIARHLKRSMRS